MEQLNKRGQTGGLITGLVFGIAALVIGVIIAFVVVGTLSNANLMTGGRVTTSVLNEVGFINATTYTLTNVNENTFDYSISSAVNRSSGAAIPASNYTLSSRGILTNTSVGTGYAWNNVSLNYTYITYSNEELATTDLVGNFTSGIDNVSGKLPTALLVAAIVLILAILGVLVGVWQKMRMGGGSI
ncbi:MAG: hypothetical protein WC679_12435 [Bacteroidales bacterium]|jgi:hypothetical protein